VIFSNWINNLRLRKEPFYIEKMDNQNLATKYLAGLIVRLPEESRNELSYTSGASFEDLARLKKAYPECPQSLFELLSHLNGTYHQTYGNRKFSLLILGSEVDEFQHPHYLKSVDQILFEYKDGRSIRDIYKEYFHLDLVQGPIDPDISIDKWLCFSDCFNNGGTSRLYIDFNPMPGGTKGQIVQYIHDPDIYKVIANSFDE